MKKFMIFLLMAFLYLGTCQARSEATHFDNANVKLHSWVLPSSAQSFSMDVKAMYGEPIVKVTPSQPQNLCLSCPRNEAVFGLSYDENGSGESVASRVWMVNDHNTDSTGATFTFGGYAAGQYTVACKVTTNLGNTYISNYVVITVDVDAIVNVVGPDHACQNDVVTLAAQVENSSFDVTYQWRRDGQYIIGATERTYSFLVDTLPGLTDTLAYEFDVQITKAGCDSKYSPVHYFTVSPTPVTLVDVPLFCKNEPVTLTANSYTSGSEQPYMWKWIKDDDTTITYVNTLTISNPSTNDKYKVIPIYQDFACNADTAEVTLKSYQDSLGITTNLKELTLTASQDTVCLDGMVQFNVSDGNISNDKLGAATYTWYMNGTLIPDATDTTYTVALSNAGDHVLKVVASYSNYPCENPVGTDTVTVDTVPANVVITGPNVLCQNQDGTYNDTTLVAHVIPEGPSYQYKWTGETNFKADSSFSLSAPGVYSVIVKTQGGCEAIATFEVLGFGADVNITSTTVGCPGEPVTLSANADGWTGTVSYVWANASNPALSNNNLLTVTATTTETAYWVTSTVNLGGNESCSRTDTIKVKALEVPTPNPIVERLSADSICEGQLAIFRVKNASSITGVSQFVWYQDGIEIPGFNLDTIAVELTVPGMHGFQAAAFNPSGCASAISAADSIKVKAVPALVNITGDAVICENDSTVLRVHAEGDNLTYKWSDGSEKDSLVAHAGVYSVTVSSMEGCSAVAEFTVNTIGSEVQLTANTQNVCAGESVTLNVQATGWTSGNISYEWVDITDGRNNNQVTFVPTHDGYYKVITTVESTSGTCTRTDSIYINVDTVKIDEVAYIGGDTLCLGTQATMHVKSSNADHFIWYVNGIEIPGENLDTLRVQPDAPGFYTYSVAAISNTGCASKDTTIKPDLYILPNPTVQITGDQILCNDSTVRLVALLNDTTNTTANGANGEYTYMWRLYNQNLNSTNTVTDTTITIDGVEHKFTVKSDTLTTTLTSQDHPYIFTVNVVNANGCVAESAPYNVFIGKDLFVDVTVDHDTVCEGGLVTATAHLGDYNLENLTYQWYEINKVTSDTDTVANGTSITYTTNVDTSTVFMVKITQTTTGCTITGKDSVYILPVKMLKIVATNETPLANETDSLFVCKGEGIYLTAYVINEETGETKIDSSFSYVWYENGRLMEGYTRPTFNKQVDIIDDDTLSYQYAAYIDFGIDGCEPQLVYSNVVFVKRNPVVTIRGNQNVCYFGNFEETGVYNVHLIAWVDGGYDTTLTYTWYEHGQVREGVGGSIYDNHYRENWIPTYDNPYSFTVMVSNSDGCVTISEPFEVNVYNKPAVNITATETTICEGGKTELTAHIDNYNEPMLTYQWYKNSTDPDNAIPGMTESVETFWPEDTTTYIVKVTHLLENGMPDRQACFNTASYVINVNDIPVIDSVTNDLADANDTICEGRFVTLTAHMHGGVPGGEVYTWYRNGAVIPEAHDSIYVETPEAVNGDITTYHYAVSVRQTAAGCESDTTQAAVVTVFPNPVLTLVTDPIVCDTNDLNIMMYANVNPIPTSPYHFTWFEDNSVDTLAAAADVVYSGEHQDTVMIKREFRDYAYSFSVQMINEFGCTVRDNANVLVNDNPVVHAISSDYTICTGGEITLTANLDDYNADMLEFHWYDVFNGDTTDMVAATNMTYTFKPDSIGTHNYFMTAQQRNSWCIAQSNNVEVLVKVDPIIKKVVLSDYIACEGAQVRVEAIADSATYTPSATDVYTWYRNGVRIIGATNRVLYDTPTTVDQNTQQFVYTAVVTLEEPGCTSLPVDASALTIYRNPVVTITGDQHVCETDYTFLIANVDTLGMNVGNLHYTWYVDGQISQNMGYNLGDNRFFAEVLYPRDEAYRITVNVERGDVANACASLSAPYEVYVYPKPDVNITAVNDITDICVNGEVTLQANLGAYDVHNMTFQWYEVRTSIDSIAVDYLPGGGYVYDVVTTQYNYYIPGATGFRYSTTLAKTTTLGVKVLQTNSQCYDIDEYTVTVHRTPAAPVIAVDNDTICSAGDATLVVTNDYSEYGTPIYAWTMDGQVIPGVFGPSYHQEPGLTSGTTHLYNAVVAFAMPGCISLASDSVSVEVIDDPIVTVTAEGPTEICEGGSVTFSANPQPDIYNYTYQWYDYHNDLMNGETNSTLTISPDAHQQDYQYVVYVNSFPGCQVIASAPIVTVHADPRLALSIDNESICEGGISTLTVDVTGGISDQNGIDPYTYTWYSNNNTETPFAVTNVPSLILPDTLPVDTFAYWVEVSANTYGCASTSEHVNQYVVADPIVNIMVAPTYPETVCDGGSTLLLATVEGGVPGGETYQWNRNGIIWVGETNPTFNTGILSINDLNSYSVVVAQSASGCMTLSDTFSVPVIETYNVAVSALNNVTVCEGGTTTLEASITNTILSNDNPTFQWYEVTEGDAHFEIPGATSARYTTSPILTAGRHTYYVAVNSQITNAHCSAESGSVTTEVVNDPTVTVTTSAHDNVVCDGDVVRVNATVAPAVGEYTYNWTWTNGTNSGSYSNNEPTFTPTDLPASINGYLFNVSIVSTDVNSGCNATSNNNTYVVVMPRPVVTISANNSVVCAGGNVELTANHNASDYTGYNYEWYINGTRVPSTSQTITVPASMINEGSLSAIVNVTSSQITMDCPSSDTVNQLVQVLAQPTISLTSNHLTMCEGARPTLTATVAGNNNIPMTYIWNFGGQTLTGVTGNVYQSAPLAAGIYNVNVEAVSQNADLNCQTSPAANAVVLRVAETPVVNLTSADGLAICEGGSITLTATVVNANDQIGDFTNGSIYGAYNYYWTLNDNPALPQPHNNISLPQDQITQTLNTVGVYDYNVYVTPVGQMAFGCGVASPAQPLQVAVNARPNWDAVAVNPANGNICLGEEVQLHAHITGGVVDMNGNTNGHIQWVVEYNGVASNVSNYGGDAAHTPTEPGLYTYYPTYVPYEGSILGSGCSFTNSDQVLSYVTVHELPTAEFVSGNGTILCANVSDDRAALTIHFTGTAPFTFQVLDLTTGTTTMYTSYTNDYTIYVSPDHTTQYSITSLSDEYCNGGELGLGAIATIFVNDIRFTNNFFVADCDADVVTIDFTMVSGTANSDFTVTYDNGLVVNGTISNNTATFPTPNVPGDYNAVFSVGGCDYDIIVRRPVHTEDFSDGTVPFMMQRWDDVAIINNNPATNGGHTFVSYQWYRNGEAIPGAIYKNYQEEGGLNGYYSIEVISQDADGRTVTYRTCEQYFSSNSAIRVYPVPANVQQVVTVEIDMTAEELEGATLDIYNVTGAIINHITNVEPITKVAGFKAAGTYFGRITMANGETKTVKFVIVK